MQKYCTDGKADVAPKRKEAREVIFVKVIDTPTSHDLWSISSHLLDL